MYKLLVADDENIIRRGIVDTLHKSISCFEIYEASNGEETLQIIEEESIDALIIDIKMPKVNGITVLKRLRENGHDDVLVVVLTGYDEFDYAQNALEYGAVKYILKPMVPSQLLELAEEIKKTLDSRTASQQELAMLRKEFQKNRNIQKGKVIQDILYDNYSEKWLQERIRVLDIKLQGPYYQIAVLGLQKYKYAIKNGDGYLLDYSLSLFLEEYFSDSKNVEFFQLNSNKYIFLFNAQKMDDHQQIDFLYDLKEQIEEKFNFVCGIGVGAVCDKISDIKYSYNNAEFAIRYLNIQQLDYVVSIDDIKQDVSRMEPGFNLDEYVIALKFGNIDEALGSIADYFKATDEITAEIDTAGFYLTADQIILATFQTLLQTGGNLKEIGMDELSAMRKIYEMNTLSEMNEFVQDLVRKVSTLIKETKTDGRNNTINKIKKIVNEEYSQPLSMKYIADQLYLNHIYLGQIFKKETGSSLNDYINKVRIGKAKKLLKESNDMIYEVADQVGFSDPQYFSTVFKKIVGVSPKEYRDI